MKREDEIKLITEFMHMEFSAQEQQWVACKQGRNDITVEELQLDHFCCNDKEGIPFDRSWDCLMPVVETICKIKVGDGVKYVDYAYPRTFGMLNDSEELMVRLNGFMVHSDRSLKKALYNAVVEFLEWYKTFNFCISK